MTSEEEKAKLRAEAEAAKQQPPPAPPKIGSIPVGEAAKKEAELARDMEETEEEEMKRFIATFEVSLAPVKSARSELKHVRNIEKSAVLAKSLAAVWVEFKTTI